MERGDEGLEQEVTPSVQSDCSFSYMFRGLSVKGCHICWVMCVCVCFFSPSETPGEPNLNAPEIQATGAGAESSSKFKKASPFRNIARNDHQNGRGLADAGVPPDPAFDVGSQLVLLRPQPS